MGLSKEKVKNLFIFLILTALIFICSKWLLTSDNFFVFDDYHNLVDLPHTPYSNYFQIIPDTTYCSRPTGWIIVKILLDIFGLNYFGHLIVLLLIHSLNSFLVYLCAKRFFENIKNKSIVAFVSSLIFAIYPVSVMPSFWESAIFDLFGTTTMLLCVLLNFYLIDIDKKEYTKKKKILLYIITSALLIIIYYIGLRSKEMFILVPMGIFLYNLLQQFNKDCFSTEKKFQIRKFNLKQFLKNNICIFILIIIMFAYFGLTQYLNSSNKYTTNVNDAYYYTFDVVGIAKNYFNYIYYYFDLKSLVYADIPAVIPTNKTVLIEIIVITLAFLGLSIFNVFRKKNINLVLLAFYSFIIMPVLPMPNLHATWYLYAPSVFMAMIVAKILYDILNLITSKKEIKSLKYILCILVLASLLLMNVNENIRNFRHWWMGFAKNYKYTYEYFLNLKEEHPEYDTIYIINVPDEYTTLYIEHGGVVKVAYDMNVDLYLNDESYKTTEKKYILVDYNNCDFKVLNEI